LTDCSLLYKIVADGCVTSGDTVHKICFRRAKDLLQVCIARTRDQHGRHFASRDEVDACLHLLTIRLLMDGTGLALVLLESSEDTSKCE
jgi:hypothetical protein